MALISEFTEDGLLPPGDYDVMLDELRRSILVVRPRGIVKIRGKP